MAIVKRLDQVKKTALDKALETLPQVAMSYMQSVNMEKAASTQKALKLMETLATNSSSFGSEDQYRQALNMMEGMSGTLKGDNYGSMLLNNYIETTGRNYKNMLANQDMKASLSSVGTQVSGLSTEFQTGALGEIMTNLDNQLNQFSGQLTKETIASAADKKQWINNLMNIQNTLQLYDTSSNDPSFDWRVTNSFWDSAIDMLKDPNADMSKVQNLVKQGRDYLYKSQREKYNQEYTMFGSEISNFWGEGTEEDPADPTIWNLWNTKDAQGFNSAVKQGYFGRFPGAKVKLTEDTADEFKEYHEGFFKELILQSGANDTIKGLAKGDGSSMMQHLSKTVIDKILAKEGYVVDPENFKTVMKEDDNGNLVVAAYDWQDLVSASKVKEFLRDNMSGEGGLFIKDNLINPWDDKKSTLTQEQHMQLEDNISGIIANQLLGWNKIDQFEKDAEHNFQSNIIGKGGAMDPLSLDVGDIVDNYFIDDSGKLATTPGATDPATAEPKKNIVTYFDPDTGEPLHQEVTAGGNANSIEPIINPEKDTRISDINAIFDQMPDVGGDLKDKLANEFANSTEHESLLSFLMDPNVSSKLNQLAGMVPPGEPGVFEDALTTQDEFLFSPAMRSVDELQNIVDEKPYRMDTYSTVGDYGPEEHQGAGTQFAQMLETATGMSGDASDYTQGPLNKLQSELIALGNIVKTGLGNVVDKHTAKKILGSMPDRPDIPLSDEITDQEVMEQLLNIIPGSEFADKLDISAAADDFVGPVGPDAITKPKDLYLDLQRKDALNLISTAIDAAEGFSQTVEMEPLKEETEVSIEYPDDTMGNYLQSLDEVANAESRLEILQSELDEMNAQAHAYWMTPEGNSGSVMDSRGVVVPEQATLEGFTRVATSKEGSALPEGIDADKYAYHTALMDKQNAHANQIQVLKDQIAFGNEMVKKDMSNLSGTQLNTIREAERMGLSPSEYLKQFPRSKAMNAEQYYNVRISSIDKQLPPLRIALKKAQNTGDTGKVKNLRKQIARLAREQKALQGLQTRLSKGQEVPTYIRGKEYPWWLLEWSDALDRDINRYNEVELSR